MAQDKYLADAEDEILKRLGQAKNENIYTVNEISSISYKEFREDEQKLFINFFEKYCDLASKLMPFIKIKPKSKDEYQEYIDISTLNVTPNSVFCASILSFLLSLLLALPVFIFGLDNLSIFILFTGIFLSYVTFTYPKYKASVITIHAQQESLLAILYISLYVRVNPVIENAIFFATEHLNGPLGKDLKQVLWLLETEKVGTIDEAIKFFIPLWVKRNKDFVRSFLILHSIAGHSDLEDRERILTKALDVILSNTYTNMKIYSYNLKTPVTVLNSFGMMLPLIGLIAFPMLSIFLSESVNMSYLFFGYLLVLPALIFFIMNRILSRRPGAFSFPDLSNNKTLPPKGKFRIERKDKYYDIPIVPVALIVGFLIMVPGLIHLFTETIPIVYSLDGQANLAECDRDAGKLTVACEYTMSAMFISMTIPMGFAAAIMIYFFGRSYQKLKLRETIMEIEADLPDTIFQFGNKFTEQIPIESAVREYIEESELLKMKKRSITNFFVEVRDRIENEGVTFNKAIFGDAKLLSKYPSVLLQEIMWIITEGSKKGAQVLYKIITNISTYLDNIKKIKELIYDLLVETSESIKMQAKFLAPFLAAVVGSLALIIVKALFEMSIKLTAVMKAFQFDVGADDFFSTLFNFAQITPPTVFQLLVGFYMVETVVLLSILDSGVENGFDNVSRDYSIAKNLLFAVIIYIVVTIIGTYALGNLVTKGAGI